MHSYLIKIVMHDGSKGQCKGRFVNDWAAVDAMLDAFFEARHISARRLA